MVADLAGPILDLILRYGPFAFFVFLMLDAAMLLPLVPGELLLVMAVQRYAVDHASLAAVVIVATLAATTGNLILYGIARGGGRRFFEKHPRLFLMSPKRRDAMERLFQRPAGQSLVFFLRLLPLARLLVNIPAGLARMPLFRFILLTVLGNLLFHAGFLFVAFESRRPESPVATYASIVQNGYANPAMDYVQTNWLLSLGILLVLGLILSLRASRKAMNNPHEPMEGSLLGALASLALFWGGVAILAGLWVEPDLVYQTIRVTGYDARDFALGVPYEPLSLLISAGVVSILLSMMVSSIRRKAKRFAKRAASKRKQPPVSAALGR